MAEEPSADGEAAAEAAEPAGEVEAGAGRARPAEGARLELEAPPSDGAAQRPPGRGVALAAAGGGLLPCLAAAALLAAGVPQAVAVRLGGADRHEPNDTLGAARPVRVGQWTGLSSPPGDVDWFLLTVPPGAAAAVSASPPPALDGEVSVHRLDGAKVASDAGRERCVFAPPGLAGGEFAVRVWGARRQPYALSVEWVAPEERLEPNDDFADAPLLPGLEPVTGLRCDGVDWLALDVPASCALTARLVGAEAGLELNLLAGWGGLPAPAGRVQATLEPSPLTRRAWAVVRGEGDYGLEFELARVAAAPGEAAAPPLRVDERSLEPNEQRETAAVLSPNVAYPNLVRRGDDWYRVPRGETQGLVIDVEFDASLGYLQLDVQAPRGRGKRQRPPAFTDGTLAGRRSLVFGEFAEAFLLVTGSTLPYRLVVQDVARVARRLQPGTYPGLAGDGLDLYRIAVPAEAALAVTLTERGDPSRSGVVGLWQGERWVRSGTRRREASVELEPTSAARDVVVAVFGEPRRYDLSANLSTPARPESTLAGPPARFELTTAGVYRGRALRSAAAYALDVAAGQRVRASVTERDEAELRVELLDAQGAPLAAVRREQVPAASVEAVADRAGRVYVRLEAVTLGRARYDLALALDGSTAPPRADSIELGVHPGLVCEHDRRLRLDAARGARLRVEMRGADPAVDLDLALHDAQGVELVTSAGPGANEALDYTPLADGPLFLRVHGGQGAFDLVVRAGD